MKLLIINDFGMEGGGTENRIRTLIDYFVKNRSFQEIHVLQGQGNREEYGGSESSKESRVKIHRSPKGYFGAYHFTKKIIRQYGIDIVQAHNMVLLTPAPILAAKMLGRPVVWYAHDYWAMCMFRNFIDPYNAMNERLCGKAYGKGCARCRTNLNSSIKLMLWKRIINKADLAVATGRKMVDIYENDGILKGRWKIITPWIDPLMLGGSTDKGITRKRNRDILFVGSTVDFKGAWVAAMALKYVLKEIPGVRLVLIGEGQEKGSIHRKKIESIIKENNLSGNVVLAGRKNGEQIKKELGRAGLYVCPTVCMESFGLNWAEAMANGCPVIASRIGTIPEHINGKNMNGILFEPRNHHDLARAMIKVLKEKSTAHSLGKKGSQYASEHFNIEKSGRRIVDVYKNLLKRYG